MPCSTRFSVQERSRRTAEVSSTWKRGVTPSHGGRRVAPRETVLLLRFSQAEGTMRRCGRGGTPRPWRSASRRPCRVHEFHLRRQVPIAVATFRPRRGPASGTRTQSCSLPLSPGVTLVLVGRYHLEQESTQRRVVVFAQPMARERGPQRP